jgi:hypothetical protein
LLIGAFVTVSFMLFFNLENFQLQMLMTGILTGFLTFMLFLIYTLDHVYEGSEAIQPAAFQEVEASFEKWEKE